MPAIAWLLVATAVPFGVIGTAKYVAGAYNSTKSNTDSVGNTANSLTGLVLAVGAVYLVVIALKK